MYNGFYQKGNPGTSRLRVLASPSFVASGRIWQSRRESDGAMRGRVPAAAGYSTRNLMNPLLGYDQLQSRS
eukprot:1840734-Rhodomonas_salina.4